MEADKLPVSEGFIRPFLLSACIYPLHIVGGAIMGQSAGMLPQLLNKDSSIPIDMEQATWIASSTAIGTCISSAISGPLSDMFGRMRVVQMSYFLMALGHALMMAASSFTGLVVGRLTVGLGLGCDFASFIYVSETVPAALRGVLMALYTVMCSLGFIYIYVVGGYYHWTIATGINAITATSGLALSFFLYETPVWLVRQGRLKAARKSLRQSGIAASNLEAKLKELQDAAENKSTETFSLGDLLGPTVWKPFSMVCIMAVLQNMAGFYIVISYSIQFMAEFHSGYSPVQVTVGIAVVRLIAMTLTSFWMRHARRRVIGSVSGFGSSACLLAVFAFLHFGHLAPVLVENQWILIALFFAYIFTMTLGIYALPWTMPFEIFPMKVRGLMSGMTYVSQFIAMFVSVKLYNVLMDNLHLQGMILMFAVGSALFGSFCVTWLVETHRRTLDEIEAEFAGKSKVYT
nr:PREDICTED: facilitated trehalose transporter Tret1-like [Bemisia tabaci]